MGRGDPIWKEELETRGLGEDRLIRSCAQLTWATRHVRVGTETSTRVEGRNTVVEERYIFDEVPDKQIREDAVAMLLTVLASAARWN